MALGEQFPDVLNAARSGAPWALERLYREFHPAVLAFLRARAPADAEDLASEVFIAVAEGLRRFEGDEDGFRSWLFTITYRQVGQLRRRMGRRRTEPFPVEEVGERVPPGDAERDAMAAISTHEALELISTLPPFCYCAWSPTWLWTTWRRSSASGRPRCVPFSTGRWSAWPGGPPAKSLTKRKQRRKRASRPRNRTRSPDNGT